MSNTPSQASTPLLSEGKGHAALLQELQQESIVPPLPPLPPLPTISKPNYIYVGTQEMEEEAKRRYKPPVVDVSSSSFKPLQTVFKVFGKNE